MKVYIGKYSDYIGPYQIADSFKKIGISKETCDKMGDWLASTWINDFLQWIDSKKKRKIKVHIDNYDLWNMDSTLAYIILPMLEKMKTEKHGSPFVEDEDVPDEIKSTSADPKKNEWDSDEFFHDRWEYVLNEMVWGFSQVNSDWDKEIFDKHQKRMDNSFRLFGKYYQALWT